MIMIVQNTRVLPPNQVQGCNDKASTSTDATFPSLREALAPKQSHFGKQVLSMPCAFILDRYYDMINYQRHEKEFFWYKLSH